MRTYPAVLTLLCSYFSSHLPCCALIFLRTYPAYEEVFNFRFGVVCAKLILAHHCLWFAVGKAGILAQWEPCSSNNTPLLLGTVSRPTLLHNSATHIVVQLRFNLATQHAGRPPIISWTQRLSGSSPQPRNRRPQCVRFDWHVLIPDCGLGKPVRNTYGQLLFQRCIMILNVKRNTKAPKYEGNHDFESNQRRFFGDSASRFYRHTENRASHAGVAEHPFPFHSLAGSPVGA